MLFCECNEEERKACRESKVVARVRPDYCRFRNSAMSLPRYKYNIPEGQPLDYTDSDE